MADELENKIESEITEASEKVEEAVKEEAAVAEKVEQKAAKAAEAAKDATAAAATAAVAAASADATKQAAKEAEAAAKAAKKAEEQAAKEAAKRQAALEKEQAKARAAQEKAAAKAEKKRQKREAQQALIDACPPQYRPVSTSKYFWLAFLSFIPVIGVIATLILCVAGRNRNVKNFEKAILAYYIIALILCLIAIIVVGVCLPADTREEFLNSLNKIISSVSFG